MSNEQQITLDDYKKVVRQKVENAKDLLMHGVLGPARGKLRDADGYDWTKSNIINVATNYYKETGGVGVSSDPLSPDAIDFSIYLASHSLIPYVAIDRALQKPEEDIYYMNLPYGVDEESPIIKPDFVTASIKTRKWKVTYKHSPFAIAFLAGIVAVDGKTGAITADELQHVIFENAVRDIAEKVNKGLINMLFGMADELTDTKTLDLNEHSSDSNNTKLIKSFFVVLSSNFINKSHLRPTVCITGTKGVTLLRTCLDVWQDAPEDIGKGNGIVGTFRGTPVFRHVRVDKLESLAKANDQAWFLLAHKTYGNYTATMAYGEYLPPIYKKGTKGEDIYTQRSGFAPIQKNLITKGIITSPTFI